MRHLNNTQTSGYIILTGVLIIGAVVLIATVAALTQTIQGTIGDYNEESVAELYARTAACTDVAFIKKLQTFHYLGNEDIIVGGLPCTISQFIPVSNGVQVDVLATSGEYTVGVQTVVHFGDGASIVSRERIVAP